MLCISAPINAAGWWPAKSREDYRSATPAWEDGTLLSLGNLEGTHLKLQLKSEASTSGHVCEFKDMLGRLGDKWSMLTMFTLAKANSPRLRFSELKRRLPGISRRMLSSTLRQLERDGVLSRHVFAEIPPRVEYQLTSLGKELLMPVRDLIVWLEGHWDQIQSARGRFDRGMDSSLQEASDTRIAPQTTGAADVPI
jgi:DNA-binding HxlR family transcriptional regulator